MSTVSRLRNPLKRVVDILGSLIGLIVLAPVFIVLWLIVRIKLGSPVIFTQRRAGKDGKSFALYKFRSMLQEDSSQGRVTDDQRMTPFGRRLRAWSLDELPTLVNVLKGDMSLVGPRPLMPEYLRLYSDHQARRHEVRPGITGLAQVRGRNAIGWEDRFDLDVEYVDRHNLLLDVALIFQTIGRVFSRSGVEGDVITTMTIFVGAPPQDGLTEVNIAERDVQIWERWKNDPQAIQLGVPRPHPEEGSRYWLYRNAQGTPVGIAGLRRLGEVDLEMYLLLSPDQDRTLVETLINRLVHHGRSYDARLMTLHLPQQKRALHRTAQHLGFVAAQQSTDHRAPATDRSAYSLALAAVIGE